ncbi:MAG: acyl carrier protein [Alphaproteobacteria bacterium PA3]|nr:MAG: acyl carrier protein [Alphaproteobacteria bacterium PA3]
MSNREIYDQIFKETFNLSDRDLNEMLEYQSVKEWDSVGHMSLVSALEEAFDIMLEMDDIVDFGTYHTGIATMRKYGVDI